MNSPIALRPDLQRLGAYDSDQAANVSGMEIDLRRVWSAVYRNRFLILAIVGLSLIGSIIITMLSTRIYSAQASVQVEQQTSRIMGSEDPEAMASMQDADRFLQTQVDILKSRALAERVGESLGLYANDNFIVRMGGKPSSAPMGRLSVAESKRERVVRLIMQNLAVSLPRTSRIVTISFSSPDPNIAAQVANSYAQNFISSNLQRRFDASAYARSFLEKQLALAKTRLESSERASIAYARSAGLLDTSGGISASANGAETNGPRSLTTSDLVQFNNVFLTARATRVAAEQRWQQAARTPLLSLPEVQSNPAIQQLSQQRAVAQASYEQDLQRRKEDFPSMKQSRAQINALDQQINQIAKRVLDGIRDQYQTALKQEQSLASNVGRLKGQTLAEQDRSVQYNIIKREADTNRTMYDALLQRYKEVSAQAGVTSNNISMLDSADLPVGPISPRPMVNLLVAVLVGITLSAIVVFARERFDDAIRLPEEVPTKLNLPFLNSIPMLPNSVSPREALDDVRSNFAESYYALRTSLRLISSAGLPRSLLVTSSREAEGKSTTAFALARGFAQIGMKVLLIDGDMRKPSMHRLIQARSDLGLSNLLAREAQLEAAVQVTDFPNLSFVSSGPLPPSPTELLSGATLPELLERASGLYDLVVIDGPPVLGLADAILYAVVVGGTVYVVEAGRGKNGQGKAALRRLLSSGARVMGAVLTKFDPRQTGYGDEYGYYYSYGSRPGEQRALKG